MLYKFAGKCGQSSNLFYLKLSSESDKIKTIIAFLKHK